MRNIFKILFIFLLTAISLKAKAQDTEMYKTLNKLINIDYNKFVAPNYNNRSFVFFIGIDVNSKGLVENVIYSEKSELYMGLLFDFKDITAKLKANKKDFLGHKSEVLILMVNLTRGDDDLIKNGDEVIEGWKGIFEDAKKINNAKKKMTFLVPMLFVYGAKSINN